MLLWDVGPGWGALGLLGVRLRGMRDDHDEAGPDIEFVGEGRKKDDCG